jgi:hypothetical protein
LTVLLDAPMGGGSCSPRASPETSQNRSGMRRPAGWLVTTSPAGGVRQHRPSATTSGTCECTDAASRAPLMCNARRRGQGGLGANKSPRWSAERRASPARGLRKRICAGCETPGGVCGPASLAREGCLASTRAPVGAPLPSLVCEGKPANLGGQMPREKADACAQFQSCRTPLRNKSENGFIAFTSPGHDP